MGLEKAFGHATEPRRVARIVVRGEFGAALGATVANSKIEAVPDGTRITVHVRDEAELFGLVERVRNLGAPLVSISLDAEAMPPRGNENAHEG